MKRALSSLLPRVPRPVPLTQLGQTTLEYSMLLGIMAIFAITVSGWLIDALRQSVALLSFKIAIYLTGFPY